MKILFLIFFALSLNAEGIWLVKEEFLSPEIEHFDCHSSSIIETEPGKYCVVWKGGPGVGQSNINIAENVGIWMSRFDEWGWSEPKEVVSAPQSVCWTPVLCKNPLGGLLLFYRIGPDPRRVVSFLKKSHDAGVNWSKEEILPAGIIGPTKAKPIVTSKGVLISPSSVEVGAPQDLFKATACWVEISEDGGVHWKKIGPLELAHRKFGVIEPALFFDAQKRLRMLCRDRANKIGEKGYIWTAVSEDEGLHWSELKQTDLPNPDSGVEVVDLGEGKLILVYNHSHTHRHPLNVAVSLDGGDSWSEPLILNAAGEFPSAILSSDGFVHITYAISAGGNEQRRIKHAVIDPKQLVEEAMH